DFIVTFLVLFDKPFEADVAADFQSAMVAGKKEQQTRSASVAVAERVDAEEVKIQSGGKDERMNPFFANATLPQLDHLGHRRWRFFRADSLETNATAAVREGLDDVHLLFLVGAGIPDFTARKCVKFLDRS